MTHLITYWMMPPFGLPSLAASLDRSTSTIMPTRRNASLVTSPSWVLFSNSVNKAAQRST